MMMLGLRKQKQKRREVELEQRKHVQDRAALEERREAAVELEKSAHAAATGYGSNVGASCIVGACEEMGLFLDVISWHVN